MENAGFGGLMSGDDYIGDEQAASFKDVDGVDLAAAADPAPNANPDLLTATASISLRGLLEGAQSGDREAFLL